MDGLVSQVVSLGRWVIGSGRCFVIAEAGVNHNGDPALAHRLVDVAADAGADAVKFQTFDPDQLVARDAQKARYQVEATGSAETQLEMLRRLVLPVETFAALRDHASDRGIAFLSTAFDLGSARMLVELGVPAIKEPSGELDESTVRGGSWRRSKPPLLVSTGMATLDEVSRAAVAVVRRLSASSLALFHCVTNYPAPASESNLAAMATMRRAFDCPVGWSDHTQGINISIAAVALGAELIEKHFTLDRTLPGPDHAASLEPTELADLMIEGRKGVREGRSGRAGTGEKSPAPSELENTSRSRAGACTRRAHWRRALCWSSPTSWRFALEPGCRLRSATA